MRNVLLLAIALATLATSCSSGKHHVARVRARPSSNPYVASLAYAKCLRGRGVPHPNPNRKGDFELTRAQEARLRSVPKSKRDAAMTACFHNLAGLNNQPLSDAAHRRAIKVLLQLKRCMKGFGYQMGKPIVQNESFGRAMFGFQGGSGVPMSKRLRHAQSVCEQRVDMARKISRIIAADRKTRRPGGF